MRAGEAGIYILHVWTTQVKHLETENLAINHIEYPYRSYLF